jgi:hypothetical protein
MVGCLSLASQCGTDIVQCPKTIAEGARVEIAGVGAQLVTFASTTGTKTGHFWAYAADDGPWGGCDPPAPFTSTQPIANLNGR